MNTHTHTDERKTEFIAWFGSVRFWHVNIEMGGLHVMHVHYTTHLCFPFTFERNTGESIALHTANETDIINRQAMKIALI